MSNPVLGTILKEHEGRDAIHIAIASVTATQLLHPGEYINFVKPGDMINVESSDSGIGIVDPFLRTPVFKGDIFRMFLLPNTITSLRHEWTHPAFVPPPKDEHVEAIERIADQHGLSYDELMRAAQNYVEDEEYLCQGGRFDGEYLSDDFWEHYEAVTDTVVPKNRQQSFFTCSC